MAIDTNLNKSQSSNYELVLTKLPTETTIEATKELTLNIFGTILPSIDIAQNPVYWLGSRTVQEGEMTYSDWTVNFAVDSHFDNWQTLYNWMMSIRNNRDKHGEIPRKYAITASLRILDNFRKVVLLVNFENVWISNLGEVSLTHREYDTNLEGSLTLSYDTFRIVDKQ